MRVKLLLLVVVVSFLAGGIVLADDEHPLAKQVKEKLKDPNKPFTIGVKLKVKDGMGSNLETAFGPAIKESRKEKGCLAYDLNKSVEDETVYIVYERWANLAALDAHLKSPNIEKLLNTVHEYLDGAPDLKVFVPAAE
jgi:quinol monooxygenase YgiN